MIVYLYYDDDNSPIATTNKDEAIEHFFFEVEVTGSFDGAKLIIRDPDGDEVEVDE